ncbi:MAG: PilN domain-containing protein [Nitrosomonadales bacterium]|nr:PilN domain-containing protein [Nitrosomonadales bacterium]
MIRVNLLPHRAEKRRARHIQFIALSVVSIVLGGLLVGSVQVAINTQIAYQERRNAYLKDEIAILDKQIEEINKLREQTKALLARKSVVEDLQSTRSDVVHLLDQMLRILPEGVYLKTLKQTGNKINLVGYAQSNARVSTLMRAIEDSPWLDSAILGEIHAVTLSGGRDKTGGDRVSEFTLSFNLTKSQVEPAVSSTKPAGKPAGAKS